jgi:hypothetical protein
VAVSLKREALGGTKYATRIATASGAASSIPTTQELTAQVRQVEGRAVGRTVSGSNYSKQITVCGAANSATISNQPSKGNRVSGKPLKGTHRSITHSGNPLKATGTGIVCSQILVIDSYR